MAKKKIGNPAKTTALAPSTNPQTLETVTIVLPSGWQLTQFRRSVARAYRNSIAKQVSDDLHEVILSWLSPAELEQPYLALHLDHSNYKKWMTDGTLHLRVLTQILVQRTKDFTDLYFPNGALIIGPTRAEDLQIDGTRAALIEGYKCLVGGESSLTEDEAFSLLILYRYSTERHLCRLTYSWVTNPSIDDSPQERKYAEWIITQFGLDIGNKLNVLVAKWSDVCMAVCKILEEQAGITEPDAS